MFCTIDLEMEPEEIIQQYVLPLKDQKDVNLLEYKDYKDNNVLHLFFKGRSRDIYDFLKTKIYNYMPADLDLDSKE